MTSTPNKLYTLPATGTDSGTWGLVLNGNFTVIDNNLGGTLTLSVAGSANVMLTAAQAQNAIYNFTGVLTGNINVIFPAQGGTYFINNATTGAFTLTVQAGTSTAGFLVPQGQQAPVYVDNSTSPPTIGGAAGTQYIFIASAVSGTANAITVSSTTPSNFALNPGVIVSVTPTASNTGATTLNVNGTGAIAVLKVGALGLVPVQAGDIFDTIPGLYQYNGVNWIDLDAIYFGNTPTGESSGFAFSFANWNAATIATAPLTITVPQVSLNFTYFFVSQVTAGGGAVTWTPYTTDVIWVNGVALSAGTSYVQPIGSNAVFSTDAAGNIFLAVSNLGVTAAVVAATYAPLASPVFTGTPSLPTGTTATTQSGVDSSTKLATTAYANPSSTVVGAAASAELPGGLVFKAGVIASAGAGTVTVTFPVKFATACIFAIPSPTNNNGSANAAITVTSISATAFTWVNSTGATNTNVTWLAVGY